MNDLSRIRKRVEDRRRELERAIGRRSALVDQRANLYVVRDSARAKQELYRKAVVFLEAVTEAARREVVAGFEDIVTHALRAVLGGTYSFEVDYAVKRNAGFADFRVATKRDRGSDPLTSRGGGVVDILSFALRCVVAELLGIGGPLILDEPFRHLSSGFTDKVGEVVAELAERFDRQVIVVTHQPACARLAQKVQL